MTVGDIFIIAVLGMMAGFLVGGMVKNKKNGKPDPCKGCPNYSSCRAHLGCANNPNNR